MPALECPYGVNHQLIYDDYLECYLGQILSDSATLDTDSVSGETEKIQGFHVMNSNIIMLKMYKQFSIAMEMLKFVETARNSDEFEMIITDREELYDKSTAKENKINDFIRAEGNSEIDSNLKFDETICNVENISSIENNHKITDQQNEINNEDFTKNCVGTIDLSTADQTTFTSISVVECTESDLIVVSETSLLKFYNACVE